MDGTGMRLHTLMSKVMHRCTSRVKNQDGRGALKKTGFISIQS